MYQKWRNRSYFPNESNKRVVVPCALLAKAVSKHCKRAFGYKATVAYITSKPKKPSKSKSLKQLNCHASLDDVCCGKLIPMNYVQSAGLNVEKQGYIFIET